MIDHVDRYLHRLESTRGASDHTLRAYGTDLVELAGFLEERGVDGPDTVRPRALRAWLGELDEVGSVRA